MQRKSSSSVRVYSPEMNRDKLLLILKRKIRRLSEKLKIRIAILFGSYAFNRHTPASDVDLFIVIEDGSKEEAYREIFERLKVPALQLHLYTLREYEKMKASNSSFIKEVEKGIPLI